MKTRAHLILLCVIVIALFCVAEGAWSCATLKEAAAPLGGGLLGGGIAALFLGAFWPIFIAVGITYALSAARCIHTIETAFHDAAIANSHTAPVAWWEAPWHLFGVAVGWLALIIVFRFLAHRYASKFIRTAHELLTLRPVRAVKTARGRI